MCACITPHQMVGITDKMNRFEKSFLILRERPVYPRPSIPPDALQETALPFPHAVWRPRRRLCPREENAVPQNNPRRTAPDCPAYRFAARIDGKSAISGRVPRRMPTPYRRAFSSSAAADHPAETRSRTWQETAAADTPVQAARCRCEVDGYGAGRECRIFHTMPAPRSSG